jgi:ribosomal protein S6
MSEKEGTRTYELGFLLVPTTPEAEVASHVEALKAAIEGEVIASSDPEYIDLAYQMEKSLGSKKMKYDQGYFGWMKFTAAPETLESLKKALDGNNDLIRYILVKTSAENTIVFKKPKVEPKRDLGGSDELEAEEALVDDADDMKEDHERLPDLESDIQQAPAPEPEEQEEM